MKIKFTGTATIRQLNGLEWNKENGYVVEVNDSEEILNLLTTTGFYISDDDDLAKAAGIEVAEKLVLGNVFSCDDLKNLDKVNKIRIAGESGLSIKELEKIIRANAQEVEL